MIPQNINPGGPGGTVDFASVNAALATANASIDVNGQRIVDVATPSASGDAATKGYVDAAPSRSFVTFGCEITFGTPRLYVGTFSYASGSYTASQVCGRRLNRTASVKRINANLQNLLSGQTLTVQLFNRATSAVLSGISVTVADGQKFGTATGTIALDGTEDLVIAVDLSAGTYTAPISFDVEIEL